MFARRFRVLVGVVAFTVPAIAQQLKAPESMRGEVVVRRNDANNLAVIVDQNRDGIADVMFMLGSPAAFPEDAFHTFNDATLRISERRVIISDRGRVAVSVALHQQCTPRDGKHYEGIGLGYRPNPQLPPMSALRSSRAPLAADPACHDCAVYDAVDPTGE